MFNSAVCLFGDSVARGVVLDDAGSYRLSGDSFADRSAEKLGIQLTNKARFGCTIGKGMEILTRFLGRRTGGQNAVALLEFGGNDCDFKWDEIAAAPERDHQPATPVAVFASIYDRMIEALRTNGYRPVLMTLPPLDPDRYFAWVTRSGIDKSAILSWLGDVRHIYWWHERYNDAVWATALRNRCPVVDVRNAFLARKDYRDCLCADGIHPNGEGHRLMESVLLEYAAAY
jgi:lysophospholipase L1-like esterase